MNKFNEEQFFYTIEFGFLNNKLNTKEKLKIIKGEIQKKLEEIFDKDDILKGSKNFLVGPCYIEPIYHKEDFLTKIFLYGQTREGIIKIKEQLIEIFPYLEEKSSSKIKLKRY